MNLFRKFSGLFRRRALDADMAEEMRLHVERRADENVADGMSPEEARYAALRGFGGMEQVKEEVRAQRSWIWLEQLGQDARYAFRQLRRSPGFAAVAILTLAVGTGANTAIFSLVNSLVLKPLAYDEPGQLVQVWESQAGVAANLVSPGVFLDWRTQATTMDSLAAFRGIDLNLTSAGEPERISGLRMTADGLRVLRARPLLGRIFAADEDQPGREPVIVLTSELWRRRFGSDPGIVGRTIQLNEAPVTVIGVLPPGFLPRAQDEFVVPYVFDPAWRDLRSGHFLQVMGRVKSGVPLAQARAELAAIYGRSQALFPAWKKGWSVNVVPLQEEFVGEVKPALLLLLAAVVVVLLVACTNVANLLLAKASARQREIAVRAALGASRGRVIRQLLAESVLLSLLGAGLGLALAFWSVAGLRHFVAALNLARAHEIAVDGRVLGTTLLVALVTGVAFGLAPALQASRFSLTAVLNDAARGSAAGGRRLRQTLIVAEVALALVLLVGAGLLLNSFRRLTQVPSGFAPEQALTMQLSLPAKKYPINASRAAFFRQILARIEALPGVDSAAVSAALPLAGGIPNNYFKVAGRAGIAEPGYLADYDFGTPHFFRALGIPLRRGRAFTAADESGRVAIVSEEFVRRYFPGENPLGQRLTQGQEGWEIVGVVGDVRARGLAQEVQPIVYRPQSAAEASSNPHLVVRATLPPRLLAESVRRAILEVDPDQPVASVRTLDDVVAGSVADRRLTLGLLAGFAGTTLGLAAIGLYGVIAYSVAQRTRELGIRLALGATRRDVLALVLGEGMRLVLVGLLLGLGAAVGLSRLLVTMLFQVAPTDPQTFAAVSLGLLAVALLAAWLPARRAARVDPMVALRAE
jgi:putative ABC transport system permease protein